MTPATFQRTGVAVLVLTLSLLSVVASANSIPSVEPSSLDSIIPLQLVASGLQRPTFLVASPGDRHRLFIVERAGRIRIVQDGMLLTMPFLDIAALVKDASFEQGMLSMAFHPRYADNGYFYVSYTAETPSNAVVVARYTRSADPNLADPTSSFPILTVPKEQTVHNGGQLQFDPDGYLIISLGDGGTRDFAQELDVLLGKILRIDVDSGVPYGIPPDNPFVGTPTARGEIWGIGLRNPWRVSLDRLNGDLWIGDVGESTREEVDWELSTSPGGINWGWPCKEGTAPGPGTLPPYCPSVLPTVRAPEFDYGHSLGCAVTGGYVYRGSPNSSHFGRYFLSDYCPYNWGWYLTYTGSQWVSTIVTFQPPTGHTMQSLVSFGEDAIGDLYAVDNSDGEVYKLILRPAACVAGNYDVNGNGSVGIVDIQLVAGDWLRPDFVPDYDVDCSGAVTVVDVQRVASAWSG